MAAFEVNTHRIDPYKNFRFSLVMDGEIVAGISKVSALKRSTELVTHREAGDVSTVRHSPGITKYEPITLERGITHAPEFEAWANLVYSTTGDAGVSLLKFRKDLLLNLLNLQGVIVRTYKIYRCWVSEFTAMPELDANANAVAFESIVIQNEGFERDEAVTETMET